MGDDFMKDCIPTEVDFHDLTQAPRTKHCSSWSSGSQNSISQADGNPKCVEELLTQMTTLYLEESSKVI